MLMVFCPHLLSLLSLFCSSSFYFLLSILLIIQKDVLSMLYLSFCLFICFLFSLLLVFSGGKIDKEKRSPYECGLDPSGHQLPFCVKFFLVGVIFLVFDVEISLLLPLPFSSVYLLIFITILLLGLLYEWFYGGLE